MNGWVDGWVGGWVDGRMDTRVGLCDPGRVQGFQMNVIATGFLERVK